MRHGQERHHARLRTGRDFPDILVIAKGLGAGYVPLGAVLCSQHIFDAFSEGSGAFMHGHTFLGHPVACAAALAVQRAIRGRELLSNVQARGADLRAGLEVSLGFHPHIGDIRGRGLFQAIELVANRDTKACFDPTQRIYAEIRSAALSNGLLVYAMGGTLDGRSGDHILLAPPYTAATHEIDMIVAGLTKVVHEVLGSGQ